MEKPCNPAQGLGPACGSGGSERENELVVRFTSLFACISCTV